VIRLDNPTGEKGGEFPPRGRRVDTCTGGLEVEYLLRLRREGGLWKVYTITERAKADGDGVGSRKGVFSREINGGGGS